MGSLALLAIMMSAQLVGCENRRSRRMLPSIRPIQTVGVEGQLMCGSKPLAGAKLTLWDKDTCELAAMSLVLFSPEATDHFSHP